MPDLIWTGGISETHKVAILASAHQVPFAPHDATGPVNIFACAHICISSANAMMQEHVPAFFKGWYNDIVDPNLDIRDGYLHAPQNARRRHPAEAERARARRRDHPRQRPAGREPDRRLGRYGVLIMPRSPRMRAELDRLRVERGPQLG